jgi:Circadian oscillating protein COP23
MPGSIDMKATTLTKISLISIWMVIGLVQVSMAQAQLPTVSDPQPPPIVPSPTTPTPQSAPTAPDSEATVTAATLAVRCEDLTTVVTKGERQASIFNWNTKYFGGEYTPEKRCQMVSARLQTAADLNSGTLQGLQLESGTINGQTVICVLQTGENKCTDRNLLFTLKPENAKNPQAVIAKILIFAKSGNATVDESARISSKSNLDLGNWERKAFPKSRKSSTPTKNVDTGF